MSKISELSDGSSLQSTDSLIAVRSGGNVRVKADGALTLTTVTATSLDISGDIDVDGTTNLDAVDIDGAVDMASTLVVSGAVGIDTAVPSDTHGTWGQLFLGTKGSMISSSGAGGLDGTWLTDNMYVDSDTGAFAYRTTNESSAYLQEGGVHKFYTQASGSAGAGVTLAEKMRMDSSGNVGIGTSSVDAKLHVQQGGEPPAEGMLILEANSASRQLRIQPPTDSDNGFIDYRGGNLTILDDGAEVARFQGSDSFDLKGPKLKIYTSDDQVNYYAFYTHTDDTLRINYNNAGNDEWMMNSDGDVSIRGDLTQNQSTSDIRLKEDILVIPDAVEKVESLRGVTFKFKASKKAGTGLIAQEVQKVLPEAVYTAPPRDEGDDLLALHYGNIVGLLVEAIKEQSAQIQTLKTRVEDLEN